VTDLRWQDVQAGSQLPEVTIEISYRRVVMNAAATWDWFPGHHDPFYAREQGQRTIYLSTLFFQGLVDRLVTDWAGPRAFIRRRKIEMRRSIYAGQVARASGRAARVYEDDGAGLVDVEAEVGSDEGPCVLAAVTVELPRG
jgi:acyl dehydratase